MSKKVKKRIVKTGEFIAASDDGDKIKIYEYTEMSLIEAMRGVEKEVAGLKEYCTEDGQLASPKENGTFEIEDGFGKTIFKKI